MIKFIFFILCYMSATKTQSFFRYEIQVDHLELPKRDELFDYGTLRVRKYNRTTFVVSGYFDILKPFTDEIIGQIDLYSYSGNEFRKMFGRKLLKMCTYLREDKFIVSQNINQTSLGPEIRSCPIEPQRVHFYDLHMPSDFLPFQPPKAEKYRFDLMYFSDGKVMTNDSIYVLLKKISATVPKFF